ncbi:hypothetical protein [Zooshikella harenae]|uniref:Uncharacterized protein n=1 Tax=Zooshikella harenae TaxID=2827238 RepID=A0ABS5ZIX9_9GAMM|nr:hypothetical protein [Zooshikella harenae]MBU2714036.1 hypothetical protein [Zooshikella harenae]
MAAIIKKRFVLWLLVLVAVVLSFTVGRNYQELVSMYDQYALFMNLSGDYIKEFNETLGAFDTEEANQALSQLNQRVLNDFGCSFWIHHVADMNDHDLEVFKSAIQDAFDNVGSGGIVDEECLNNLREIDLLK